MRFFPKRGITASLVTFCFLVSCKHELPVAQKPPEVKCRISHIAFFGHPDLEKRTGSFQYNAFGNPIRYTPRSYMTGCTEYELRYDDKQRLTDFMSYYPAPGGGGGCEQWIVFKYDNQNRIIQDTAFAYAAYGHTVITYYLRHVTDYEYDSKGRIVKERRSRVPADPLYPPMEIQYVYNAQGNLVLNGVKYDDKKSVYRTHPVWMFLARNYSVNNIEIADSYNAEGYPITFNANATSQLWFIGFLNFRNSSIVYECK